MNKADELFEMLQAAYLRGANWLKENGSDDGLKKAAYDYADYHTSPLTIAERSARIMSAIEPAGVGVETAPGWIKINDNLPHDVATTITEENQVLAYERGRYFNAWLIFDEYEGGWCWKDEADSEPSPSHYRWLRDVALKGDEQ